MRSILALLHRWLGLFIAIFLFIAGLTGALIAWDHELDSFLNPNFYHSAGNNQQSPLQVVHQLEAEHPELMVTFMPLSLKPDSALSVMVAARKTATHQAELPFNQIAVNPSTGEIQARRQWGAISLSREDLLPFLYKLHYSLHIPDGFNVQIGLLFMGIVGIVWFLDCFIALIISFPSRQQWRKSFIFRWRSNSHKLNFDLHRSGGVWIWGLLLIMAVTSISMNLGTQVTKPIVNLFSTITPSPFEVKKPDMAITEPAISREAIIALAQERAQKQAIQTPVGGIFYSPGFDIYGVGFYEAGNDHGDVGLGNTWFYFDGKTSEYLGGTIPGTGTAGDIFMQLQFPLHSGRIAGITGRIIVTIIGLLVAMLSITGIVIWVRKRKSRVTKKQKLVTSSLAVVD